MTGWTDFPQAFFDDLVARAELAPRRRIHHNVHSSYDEPVQRLFNAVCVDSYIRPHRHLLDPKRELLMAVRGRFALFLFDEEGDVTEMAFLSTQPGTSLAVELAPEQWHTVVALEAGSILFEIKPGPFDPTLAKEQAEWSPQEGMDLANDYLHTLRMRARSMIPTGPP